MRRRSRLRNRKGAVLVLTVLIMIVLFGVLALSIDIGYLQMTKTQMQRTADSAAMAAAWELIDENALRGETNPVQLVVNAQGKAQEFAALNKVLNKAPTVGANDVQVGYLSAPSDPANTMMLNAGSMPNAVRVLIRRDSQVDGEVPFFFAPMLGRNSASLQAEATAAILTNIGGFRAPGDGSNLEILPFALDWQTWNALVAGSGTDKWTWNAETKEIEPGADGILEANLYPQGTGSPGNRGTVDIGSSNNSTADISRQITDGITAEDLDFHGGSLELDENGELRLNADTGISAGVKDELESIKGKPRIIPIFSQVSGNGNNAEYVIVSFVGVRILDVKLTGQMSGKRVIIQPANVVTRGGISSPAPYQISNFVYSPAWLVR